MTVVAAMSGAAAIADDSTLTVPRFAKVDASLYESNGQHPAFVPASLSNRPVTVVLEMTGAPVAVQETAAGRKLTGSEKQAIRDQLKAQQDGLRGDLDRAGARVVGQMQDAYNGIQVVVPQKSLPQLSALPGVVALHSVATFAPDNIHGVPFIGGPEAWGSFGATGSGVKVASIDTGIDYTHADFGGPGTVAAWNDAKAHSTQPAPSSMFGPTAPKVKGGYDFVGDAYNADVAGSTPVPDPNPLDCFGHGSHTAGTVAGFGVLSDGSTFTGPYGASTISSHSWNVGPGVAPQADIYAYRVFGCAGSSNVVDLAIDRAVADGVDVISMSLGSPLGGTDDPTSVAAQNAFNAGITVVASAGNNGTNAYLVGSPSTDNGVLSVAAIDGSVPTYPGASLALSSGGTVKALDANGATIPAATLPVKVLKNADGSVALGCKPSDYAGTAGMLVVTVRGTCARVARAIYGQQAGAAAVLMINSSAGYPPFEGQITSNPDTGQAYTVTIPFLGAQPTDTAALVAADGGTVTLSATTVANSNYQKAASFTSGGPRNPDSAPKPDVMAPGVSVASVGMGTGNHAAVMSGTSMACPMTAGIAALVKQLHPSWHGAQIKAAIMNTANPNLNLLYNSRIAGTGVVQAQRAVNSTVIASTPDALDSIAYGFVPGAGDYTDTKSFNLTNYGTTSATYNLSVSGNGSQRGATITVNPGTVTVAAGTTQSVSVSLSIPAAAFAAMPTDDTFAGLGPGAVISIRGNIIATPATAVPTDHQQLRVPYFVAPRGLSNVTAGTPSAWSNTASTTTPGHTITAALPLRNTGIHDGTADLYAWGIHHAKTTGSSIDVRDAGVQIVDAAALGSTVPNDRGLVFLVNTYGHATNQSVDEFDVVISVNGDSTPDFVVFGYDLGQVLSGSFDGIYASFTIDAHTGSLVDAFVADAPMNGSIVELPALASDLGLSQKTSGVGPVKKQGITYTVNSFNVIGPGVESTGSATINPYSPSVSSGDFKSIAAGGSDSINLTVDTDQQFAQPALGWLVASVDNANGAAQVSEVSAP